MKPSFGKKQTAYCTGFNGFKGFKRFAGVFMHAGP